MCPLAWMEDKPEFIGYREKMISGLDRTRGNRSRCLQVSQLFLMQAVSSGWASDKWNANDEQ
jgi:hypothetical protein